MNVRSGVRRPLASDERALLDGLVRELAPRLTAYVHRVHGRRDEVEDIVAEAFCRAAANIDALRASERVDLYLLTVVRNLCRDRYRRKQPDAIDAERLAEQPGRGAGPVECATRSEQRRALQQAVTSLPENLREIVVLRLSAGLKFEQIAELLEIPLGTALSRMHTAMGRLRAKLDVNHESARTRKSV
jgi:RNA polymerase sigma-70 factor (ECF subfamily)